MVSAFFLVSRLYFNSAHYVWYVKEFLSYAFESAIILYSSLSLLCLLCFSTKNTHLHFCGFSYLNFIIVHLFFFFNKEGEDSALQLACNRRLKLSVGNQKSAVSWSMQRIQSQPQLLSKKWHSLRNDSH